MSIRFSAIGFEHGHIFGQVQVMLDAGAEFVSFYDTNEVNVARFTQVFPQAKRVDTIEEILEDESIHLVVSADVPINRAPLGIRVMQHGKDYMADKPGICTLEQLADVRQAVAETGRIYSICFSERLTQKSSVKAGELVHAGAIGQVIQTAGFGPHRLDQGRPRPDWFYDRKNFGGILVDIVSHQMDQFLYYTNSTEAEVVASTIGNFKHQQHPKIHDMGDAMVRSPHASGYVRADWLTPDGLPVWGDVRLFITGTDGYIELRKTVDIGGRKGANHLFLVNQEKVNYIDCEDTEIMYGKQLIHDILNRTETAMTQEHVFLASELAIRAEVNATDLTRLDG
jgi:predicted dehydrogenase